MLSFCNCGGGPQRQGILIEKVRASHVVAVLDFHPVVGLAREL